MTDGEGAAKAAQEKLGKHSHCQTGGKPVRKHSYWSGIYRFTSMELLGLKKLKCELMTPWLMQGHSRPGDWQRTNGPTFYFPAFEWEEKN